MKTRQLRENTVQLYAEEYFAKNIMKIPETGMPKEVIFEQPRGAIALIWNSEPHYHKIITETYIVIRGELELLLNNKVITLTEGDSQVIEPQIVHAARSTSLEPAVVAVIAEPPWHPGDHYLATGINF